MMNDQMHHDSGLFHHKWVIRLAVAFLSVATILVGAQALNAVLNFDTPPTPAVNVITVEGQGKVAAKPDIATVSFTISEDSVTASAAQDTATKKSNVALAVLKDLGIDEKKDVKTTSYNISPKYAYAAPCYGAYCPPYEQRVTGYTVSQTVEVKIRDTGKVGDVLAKLGDAGVSNVYGPNFTIENEDGVRADARKQAIDEARAKAKVLAKDLGVRLVRVVSFSEGGGSMPFYGYGAGGAMMADSATKAAPQIPVGENEISVDVSISYEVR
jgi:uncharacterized protein